MTSATPYSAFKPTRPEPAAFTPDIGLARPVRAGDEVSFYVPAPDGLGRKGIQLRRTGQVQGFQDGRVVVSIGFSEGETALLDERELWLQHE
jgi:hypothetical protein